MIIYHVRDFLNKNIIEPVGQMWDRMEKNDRVCARASFAVDKSLRPTLSKCKQESSISLWCFGYDLCVY